jgi:hypothetical protein
VTAVRERRLVAAGKIYQLRLNFGGSSIFGGHKNAAEHKIYFRWPLKCH